MTIEELLLKVQTFRDTRDWKQFHSPENLAKSVVIESAELLECFQWNDHYEKKELESEMADVFTYLLLLADSADIDLGQAVIEKLSESDRKYPVAKAKGSSLKYDRL